MVTIAFGTVVAAIFASLSDGVHVIGGQAAEAHAFAGIDLLSRGFKADALGHLRWVLEHAADRTVALELARETLRRVEGPSALPEPLP